MKKIMLASFGSFLYGTNTENSDQDFKGIFLPSKEEIFLNKIPKSISIQTKKDSNTKNSKDDTDTEIYSLHYFIHLACEGETCALDMLNIPDSMLLETSDIWKEIIANKDKFYTKNLKSFIGYCRRQASKYGIKGSRLNDAAKVLNYCYNYPDNLKLKDIWDGLPIGEHIIKHTETDDNGIHMYEVCNRKIGETSTISYLSSVVQKFYDSYGARAREAAQNKGIDWKAISHAFRAAYQVKQILTEGTITFPLKEAPFLKKIKSGEIHYANVLAPILDFLMDEVEELSCKSLLPEKVDRKFWDDFIIRTIEKEL